MKIRTDIERVDGILDRLEKIVGKGQFAEIIAERLTDGDIENAGFVLCSDNGACCAEEHIGPGEYHVMAEVMDAFLEKDFETVERLIFHAQLTPELCSLMKNPNGVFYAGG